jgi:hypothetical protein
MLMMMSLIRGKGFLLINGTWKKLMTTCTMNNFKQTLRIWGENSARKTNLSYNQEKV